MHWSYAFNLCIRQKVLSFELKSRARWWEEDRKLRLEYIRGNCQQRCLNPGQKCDLPSGSRILNPRIGSPSDACRLGVNVADLSLTVQNSVLQAASSFSILLAVLSEREAACIGTPMMTSPIPRPPCAKLCQSIGRPMCAYNLSSLCLRGGGNLMGRRKKGN